MSDCYVLLKTYTLRDYACVDVEGVFADLQDAQSEYDQLKASRKNSTIDYRIEPSTYTPEKWNDE